MSSPSDALHSFSAVIVTGGSSGIGKSFIERAAKLNPALLFCNLSRSAPVINISGLRLNHFPCDLSRPADIERVVSEVTGHLAQAMPAGRILLINNSGFGSYGYFPEPNLEHQVEMMDVNIRGLIHLSGRLLPLLRQRGGVIVSVASTAAFQPTAYMAAYGASKAFVLHWSLAMNEELRGTGVSTLAVCPGPTASEFFRRAGLQKGSVADSLSMSCDEVVDASYRALASGRSMVVAGWKNKFAIFFSSKLPKPFVTRLTARILAQYRLGKVRK